MKNLTRWLYESSPWGPFWSAWLAGYCVIRMDGQVYLTQTGEEYLEEAR